MAKDKLTERLQQPYATPVYYFASLKEELAKEQAALVLKEIARAGQDEEVTRLDGPVPDIGAAIAAAGAISFYGTPRVVELRLISPSTMGDKDVEELASLFGMLENAVLVVSAVYKDKKTASSKKAKLLLASAQEYGYGAEVAEPGKNENLLFLAQAAAGLGAEFEPGAAELLLENAGADRVLLKSETEKLAAMCGYGGISKKMVSEYAAHNIEADVFELARLITSRRKAEAFGKLHQLLQLKNEPIAICAALSGTYVDMYRVKCAGEEKVSISTAFSELGYKGSEYRLQKAKENGARYSLGQLEDAVLCLGELDGALKSSALPDKSILLEATVGELLQMGGKR